MTPAAITDPKTWYFRPYDHTTGENGEIWGLDDRGKNVVVCREVRREHAQLLQALKGCPTACILNQIGIIEEHLEAIKKNL